MEKNKVLTEAEKEKIRKEIDVITQWKETNSDYLMNITFLILTTMSLITSIVALMITVTSYKIFFVIIWFISIAVMFLIFELTTKRSKENNPTYKKMLNSRYIELGIDINSLIQERNKTIQELKLKKTFDDVIQQTTDLSKEYGYSWRP